MLIATPGLCWWVSFGEKGLGLIVRMPASCEGRSLPRAPNQPSFGGWDPQFLSQLRRGTAVIYPSVVRCHFLLAQHGGAPNVGAVRTPCRIVTFVAPTPGPLLHAEHLRIYARMIVARQRSSSDRVKETRSKPCRSVRSIARWLRIARDRWRRACRECAPSDSSVSPAGR